MSTPWRRAPDYYQVVEMTSDGLRALCAYDTYREAYEAYVRVVGELKVSTARFSNPYGIVGRRKPARATCKAMNPAPTLPVGGLCKATKYDNLPAPCPAEVYWDAGDGWGRRRVGVCRQPQFHPTEVFDLQFAVNE